jgi:N-acetyl-anhydromuramyl-L-alanine amidase AmpD
MPANEPNVIWLPNNNFFPNRIEPVTELQYAPLWVILHGTAGGTSAQAIAQYFQTVQASSHYIVGPDGVVVQCVDEKDGAWANGAITGPPGVSGDGIHHDVWWDTTPFANPNVRTIAVEHVKASTDNSNQLTDAQKQASFQLVEHICQRWQIPMQQATAQGGITGHFSMDPVNRTNCPGPYPWQDLWTFLKGAETMSITITTPTIANYFQQIDAEHWKCPQTGYIIQYGILDFYRSYGNNALCGLTYLGLPQSNETPVDGHPGVVTQQFERGILCYDPQHVVDNPPGSGPVYTMHIDQVVT